MKINSNRQENRRRQSRERERGDEELRTKISLNLVISIADEIIMHLFISHARRSLFI